MGFGDVAGSISGVLDSVTDLFGGGSGKKYPDQITPNIQSKAVTNIIDSYQTRDWKSSRGYAFQVYKVAKSDDGSESVGNAAGWKEYRLQINPQEIQQDEIFAIEVTPTLRGVLVEHHGTILKDIVISGTTGISPMRREGGANPRSGRPILASGISGYEEFNELRNYFRIYVESKRVDQREGKKELRMVFKNFKDNEFLFVEPQKFTMKRSASKPFMYDYTIVLKGIGNATGIKKPEPNIFQQIDAIIEDVTDTITLASQVINGAVGIIARTERDIADTILNPIRAVNLALLAIQGGQAQLLGEFGITRRSVDDLKREVERVEANFNDVLGRDMTAYNTISGRTPTLVGVSGRQSTFDELQILNGLGQLKTSLIKLAGQPQLFEPNVFNSNKNVADSYNGKITLTEPNTVRSISILGGDNIQSIAARELGDADRYRDIIVLNNLKPPYIALTSSPGVLKPGDKIMIPQEDSASSTGVMQNKVYNITAAFSETERNLGVDLRLTADADLAISNTGDLDLIAGVQNLGQAITIKLFTEPGGLKRHLTVGTDLQIGGKVTDNFLKTVRDQIVNSFGVDPRIDSIPFIELLQEGNTVQVNMVIKIREREQPVPIPITLNN